MKFTSYSALRLIEGFYECKMPCPAGVDTIGFGFTQTDFDYLEIPFPDIITYDQSNEYLPLIINKYVMEFKDSVDISGNLHQCQFDALIIFIYNLGIYQFNQSSVKQCVMAHGKDIFKMTPYCMRLFNKVNGKFCQGIDNRRMKEIQLFYDFDSNKIDYFRQNYDIAHKILKGDCDE